MQKLQFGVQAYQGKDLNTAEAIFLEILAVNSKEPNSLHLLGCIYKDRGQLQKAMESIQASILEDGSNPIPFVNLGKILMIDGQHENAVKLFKESLKRNQQIAETWFCLGNAQWKLDQSEDAKECYSKVLELNPTHGGAAGNLGLLLQEEGELEEAEMMLRKSLEFNPQDLNCRINYANLLGELNEYQLAVDQYELALLTAPISAELYYNYANLLSSRSDCIGALGCYQKALEIQPEFAEAYYNCGILLAEIGELEQAIVSYEKAIEVNPGFADVYLNLGSVFAEQNKNQSAIECYQKAIELKPDFAEAYLNLGNVLIDGGDAGEAIGCYRKAIALKSDLADAYFALGRALNELGQFDEVLELCAKIKVLFPVDVQSTVCLCGHSLVFDWHHRQALNLEHEARLPLLLSPKTSVADIFAMSREIHSIVYPSIHAARAQNDSNDLELLSKGYLVQDCVIDPVCCDELISKFSASSFSMSEDLVDVVSSHGVLKEALISAYNHTGFPHLAWNCISLSKQPEDVAISDDWHYDNHYSVTTPKLMVYLNSQAWGKGATEFVDACCSTRLSELTGYLGMIPQRKDYRCYVRGYADELGLIPDSLDPDHYTFSPDKSGTGVWFYPSRVLHRGVSPVNGARHVLSLSFTPLPIDCGWSVDKCLERSIEILKDKIKHGMQGSDINPCWMPS